ncbi:MAG TPA: DUF1793 domain-containing protein [Tepidisphaeraceae bacterium]|nr:DUF1793 domain-containing protein [Tepidisphaeraceae bacterium]
MEHRFLAVVFAIVLSSVVMGQVVPEYHWRPPAAPLVTCDPYFSIWSMNDHLTDGPTRHWTGTPQELTSLIRIDGKAYRIMGDAPEDVPAAHQTSLTVQPTQTIYEFDQDGIKLTLNFVTPQLPDDLSVCSWPITYVTWSAQATDGKSHEVAVYLDASANLAVNTSDEQVTEQQGSAGNLTTLRVGTVEQPVLETRGDRIRIDWGYFYLATSEKNAAISPAAEARSSFASKGVLPMSDPAAAENAVAAENADALCITLPLGQVSSEAVTKHVILAYDDLYSIRYFNEVLKGYWTKGGQTITDLLQTAEQKYDSILQRCKAFDQELTMDMDKIGGEPYVHLGSLAWRQALAAQKICVDPNGQPLMFGKENSSNGCISTVDVFYPAGPQMLAFCPTMMEASLVPLLDYASSPRWKADAAPHDLGTYPQATGQVYGGGAISPMPVEETGNLLILCAGLAKAKGNADFSKKYWPTLTLWMNYLKDHGLDPENQLCTDDFAGHLARNANLSVKAIMGIASYGMLADMLGKKDEAESAMHTARSYARQWEKMAADGDHYMLAFGQQGNGTWSQKYNLVWDKILGLNVFPPEVSEKEETFYLTKMNRFGLPLDSRKSYTKLDWEFWTATMADREQDFRTIVDACAFWASETPDRVPLSDWYDTISGHQTGFQARSVVGGLFIPFLRHPSIWQKYASRDHTNASDWAKTDFRRPQLRTIVPAADTHPAIWRYTITTPAGDWMNPGFNDSAWRAGESGFGTEGTPGVHIHTRWDTSDIYLRREIDLPSGNLQNPRLYLHHDEDAEIYINGVLAARPRGFTTEYISIPMSPAARAALHPGKNLIAVHCHQTTGGQYIDVGIVEMVQRK